MGVTRRMRTSSGRGIGRGRGTFCSGYLSGSMHNNLAASSPVDHGLCVRRHGEARDCHDIRCIVINCQRHPIISCQVRGLLAVEATEKVKVRPSLT